MDFLEEGAKGLGKTGSLKPSLRGASLGVSGFGVMSERVMMFRDQAKACKSHLLSEDHLYDKCRWLKMVEMI